jgi:hypothetical protein
VRTVTPNAVAYRATGMDYQLKLPSGGGTCRQLANGTIRLNPDASGKLVLLLDVTGERQE